MIIFDGLCQMILHRWSQHLFIDGNFEVMSVSNDGMIWNVPDLYLQQQKPIKKNLTANH